MCGAYSPWQSRDYLEPGMAYPLVAHAGCGAGSAGDPTAARHGTPGAAAGRVRRGHHLASLLSRGRSPFLSPESRNCPNMATGKGRQRARVL